MSFPLAPMSTLIRTLTAVVLLLPVVLIASALSFGAAPILLPTAAFVVAIYALVWFWYRPSRFEASELGLIIKFPWRQRETPRSGLASARIMSSAELRADIGFALRVGAGGLWGGFGWLWSRRRGWIEMYISRQDSFVWIERTDQAPLLLTPAEPERFIEGLNLAP